MNRVIIFLLVLALIFLIIYIYIRKKRSAVRKSAKEIFNHIEDNYNDVYQGFLNEEINFEMRCDVNEKYKYEIINNKNSKTLVCEIEYIIQGIDSSVNYWRECVYWRV